MKNPVFDLPTIELVGGSTEDLKWNLWHVPPGELDNKNDPFNAKSCKVTFSAVSYSSKSSSPEICRDCDIEIDTRGVMSIATITLAPEETKSLEGKFLYQLTVQDEKGEIEIVRQGVLFIWRNLNKKLFSAEMTASLPRLQAD